VSEQKQISNDGSAESPGAVSPVPTEKAPARRKRKVFLLFVLILLSVVLFLGQTGLVERQWLPALSQYFTGYALRFERIGLYPLELRNLELRRKGDYEKDPPLLSVSFLKIDWSVTSLFSEKRLFREISAHGIRAIIRDSGALALPGDGAAAKEKKAFAAPAFLLPRVIHFEDLSVQVQNKDTRASLEGLRGSAVIRSFSDLTAAAGGTEIRARWLPGLEKEELSFPEGNISVKAHRAGEEIQAEAHLSIPDLLQFRAEASLTAGEAPALRLNIIECSAQGRLPGEFVSPFLPVPVFFERLDAAPLSVTAGWSGGVPEAQQLSFDLRCTGLTVGRAESRLYDGDLSLTARTAAEGGGETDWTLQLNRKQQISGTLRAESGTVQLKAEGEGWDREGVTALLPGAYAPFASWIPPLKKADFDLVARMNSAGAEFEGNLSPRLDSGTELSAHFQGAYQHAGSGDMTIEAVLGDGSLQGSAGLHPGTGISVQAALKHCSLADLLSFVPAQTGAEAWSGTMDGSLAFSKSPGKEATVKTTLTVGNLFHPSLMPGTLEDPLSFVLSAALSEDLASLQSAQCDVEAGAFFKAAVGKCRGDLNTGGLHFSFQGEADLMEAGTRAGFSDLWGAVQWETTVAVKNWLDIVLNPATITCESLGWGDYSLPYGEVLTVTCPARLSLQNNRAVLGPVLMEIGSGTSMRAEEITLRSDAVKGKGLFSFTTDFAPVKAKGWLEEAEGRLNAELRDFEWIPEGLQGNLSFSLTPSSFVLPRSLARMSGLAVDGQARLGASPTAEADIVLEELLAGGVKISAAPARLTFQEGKAKVDPLTLGVFGGTLNLSLQWEPFASGFPLTVRSNIDRIDLGVFTDEFKPQSLVLTGIVRGEMFCVLTPSQLRDFSLMLESTENFSMNRDMVEQLLLNQYMNDVTGSRQVSRMLQSVLGKKPQTAFDRAQIKLGLEESRIAGTALLESKSLNLTVDIKADPPALLEALRIRQEHTD
jgi:hypothetical protein